jgi:maltose O-acetyltransferase
VILETMKVKIGLNILFGAGVPLFTAAHPLDNIERQSFESVRPVLLDNNCWIGNQVVTCPGVTIGSGTLIFADAVVAKDIPKKRLTVGNRAQMLRKLNQNPKS